MLAKWPKWSIRLFNEIMHRKHEVQEGLPKKKCSPRKPTCLRLGLISPHLPALSVIFKCDPHSCSRLFPPSD